MTPWSDTEPEKLDDRWAGYPTHRARDPNETPWRAACRQLRPWIVTTDRAKVTCYRCLSG